MLTCLLHWHCSALICWRMQALRESGRSDAAEQLQERVREHAQWLEANTTQQLRTYTSFAAQRDTSTSNSAASAARQASKRSGTSSSGYRRSTGGGYRGAGGGDDSKSGNGEEGGDRGGSEVAMRVFAGQKPESVALAEEVAEEDPSADVEARVRNVVCCHLAHHRFCSVTAWCAAILLVKPFAQSQRALLASPCFSFHSGAHVRMMMVIGVATQVMETASSTGGAAGVAAVLTSVLPTTLEDLMALALAGGLSYISFLTWPLKRADIKNALNEKYGDMADKLDAALEGELSKGLDALQGKVQRLTKPLAEQAQEVESTVSGRLQRLQVRIANTLMFQTMCVMDCLRILCALACCDDVIQALCARLFCAEQ